MVPKGSGSGESRYPLTCAATHRTHPARPRSFNSNTMTTVSIWE
jgi:hypothetical protein